MKNQKSLIVKSHIQEIKRVCEERGINYQITPSNLVKKTFNPTKTSKVRISEKDLKEAYQKLANSKNYEKEMKL